MKHSLSSSEGDSLRLGLSVVVAAVVVVTVVALAVDVAVVVVVVMVVAGVIVVVVVVILVVIVVVVVVVKVGDDGVDVLVLRMLGTFLLSVLAVDASLPSDISLDTHHVSQQNFKTVGPMHSGFF